MARIGIIGAMASEIKEYRERFGISTPKAGEIATGKVNGHEVFVCESGIGKVNAAITAQRMIDLHKVDYLINSGVAGCITRELNTCDAVIADCLTYHDFNPIDILDRNFPFTSRFVADERLTELAMKSCERLSENGKLFKYVKGTVVSGDCFVNDSSEVERLRRDFNALCTEMEGASIAHVAIASGIPFAVIRTMSDFADENADISFDELEAIAAKRASLIVYDILLAL